MLSLDVLVLTPRIRQHTQTHSHTVSLFHVPGTGPGIHLINEYAISYILDSHLKSCGFRKGHFSTWFLYPKIYNCLTSVPFITAFR